MAAPRKYSNRTRAKAVGIAIVDGVTAAERQTGIPKTTIQDWTTRPEYVHLRTTAREVVVADLWLGLQIGVRELTKGLEGEAPLHHKASAFQALAERFALLNGEATVRSESRELYDKPDDELALHIRAAEAIFAAGAGGTPPPPEAAPEGQGLQPLSE